jgi:hypothetical protein
VIPQEGVRQYANLYSIIYSLDVLHQLYAEGGVEPDKFESSFRDLVRQYGMVQKVFGLPIDEIARFCAACGQIGQYTMDVLRDPTGALQRLAPPARPQAEQGAGLVFDLAQICVEVVDHSYAPTDAATWSNVILTLESRLTEIGAIPNLADAVAFVRKWQLYFNALPPGEGVPERKRYEMRVEASDLSKVLKGWVSQSRG